METQKNKEKIVITLNHSTHAQKFDQESLIHKPEFDQTINIIDSQLRKINERKENTEDSFYSENVLERMHNAIAIFGERGTGKTSFLYTILDHYCPTKDCSQTNNNIEILGVIDPTLLEEKAHVFLLIISLINEKVIKKLEFNQCNPLEESHYKLSLWKSKLRKLAKGLPSLDKIGPDYQNDNWQDAEFIMEKGLADMQAAFNLDKNFYELTNYALEILHKKAFMIAFDDIDINFDKGWRVLETIRKHLTSNKFIVLMCGNLKLYNLNVCQQQKRLLNADSKNQSEDKETTEMIHQLENQYMLKVFKSQNRIHLNTLSYSLNWNNLKYYIKGINKGPKNIVDVYQEILENIGIYSNTKAYTNYLLSTSIRTQINFLRTNWDISEEENSNFSIRRIDAFLSRMYAGSIDTNGILNNSHLLSICILKYLIGTNSLKELYQLVPTSNDESINACLTGLTSIFAWYVKKNPFLIFDYILRIGYIRNLAQSESDYSQIVEMVKSSGLTQDISLKNVMGLCLAYQKKSEKYSMSEHIKIFDENHYKSKVEETCENIMNALNKIPKNENPSYDFENIKNHYNSLIDDFQKKVNEELDQKIQGNSSDKSKEDASIESKSDNNTKSEIKDILDKEIPAIKSKIENIFKSKKNLNADKLVSLVSVLNDFEYNTYLIQYLRSSDFNKDTKLSTAEKDIIFYMNDFLKEVGTPFVKDITSFFSITKAQSLLLYFPLCSLQSSNQNKNELYYSIFNLLGAIGEILKVTHSNIENREEGISETERDNTNHLIYSKLEELGFVRNYQILNNKNNDIVYQNLSSPNVIPTLYLKDGEDSSMETFCNAIYEWINHYDKNKLPPYILGKIATRFFFNLQKIKIMNLGDQMQASVVSLLNSCLITENKEHFKDTLALNGSANNNIISSQEFIDNLNKVFKRGTNPIISNNIEPIKKKIPLTIWLMNCPLLYPFVNTQFFKNINSQCKNSILYPQTIAEIEKNKKNRKDKSSFNVYTILRGE